MKKFIMSVIAVVAAAALSSCMGGTATLNTVDAAVKTNEAYAMTAEKAAGLYSLESMDSIGETTKESYKVNSILLGADGSYEFNVAVGEIKNTATGTYTIKGNGAVSFTPSEGESFSIVADGETVVCNGEKLTAEGKLGRSTVTMNYAKTTEEAEPETNAGEANEETPDENPDVEESVDKAADESASEPSETEENN